MKKILKRVCCIFLSTIDKIVYLLCKTKEKQILFESEGDFCDNARALFEYFIKTERNNKYKIIWVVKNLDKYKNKNIKNVEFISRNETNLIKRIKAYKKIYSSKYYFFTHPYWLKKWKKDQIVINLWHGTPLKSGGKDLSDLFDYQVCPSKNVSELYSKFLGVKNNQFIYTGCPRNDLLFDNEFKIENFIEKKDNKLIMFMLTYKQAKGDSECNKFDCDRMDKYVIPHIENEKELVEFNNFLIKNKVKCIVKIHHLQKTDFISKINLSNIIYIEDTDLENKNINLYSLLGSMDSIVTDYSSIIFDYALLDRPMGFAISDLDNYKKNRGFLVDNIEDYFCGDKIRNLLELKKYIENVSNNIDLYKDERKKIMLNTNKYCDNNSSQRLVDYFKL